MLRNSTYHRAGGVLLRLCLGILVLAASLSFARILQKVSSDPMAGVDFYSYWYQGHALRCGANPYREIPAPGPGGYLIPVVNTAPLALLLFDFSFCSWPAAKWLWTLVNLGLMLAIPYWVIRLSPHGYTWSRAEQTLVALLFWSFLSTRTAVCNGQTTLAVFSLMLITLLLCERDWVLAGLAFGVALSKYSLALPVLLYLLLDWRRRHVLVIGTAFLVQLAGLLTIAWITGDAPGMVFQSYVGIFKSIASSTLDRGTQATAIAPSSTWVFIVGPILITLFTAWALTPWQRRKRRCADHAWPPEGLAVLVSLVLWTLVIAYHGIYDALVVILFVPLALYLIRNPQSWHPSSREKRFLSAVLILTAVALVLPGEAVSVVLPPGWEQVLLWFKGQGLRLTLVLLLAVSLWLVRRLAKGSGSSA